MARPTFVAAYLGVAGLKARIGYKGVGEDAIILRHLQAASRSFETETRRVYQPYRATQLFRWPSYELTATWELWTPEDLLTVDALTVAASGRGPIALDPATYFLEPQWAGPPYSRIELSLASQSVFQSGDTPQRSVAVTGLWGYADDRQPAGTLTGLSFDPTETTATCSDAALLDVGDLLVFGDDDTSAAEMVAVAGRDAVTPTIITLVRGVNGTDAVLHADAAPVARPVAPADVRNVVAAEAIWTFSQEKRGYEFAIGAGDAAIAYGGRTPEADYRARIIEHYRRLRSAVI